MEKKVGKFITFFLLLASSYIFTSESTIILSMQDMNHKPITQAMCKAPFILQVELKNLDGYTDVHLMQYISGIDNFKSSRSMTSHNVSIDNGKKTVKAFYNFVLRSDKKGKFTVGPVYLKDKSGKSIRSNRLIIPVGNEVVSSEKNSRDSYFMTMNLDKKQAYVGEKLTLTVKFYDKLFVDDLHLQFPEFKNIYFIKSKNKINKRMVVIEDEEYSLTEWIFDLYATDPGLLMIEDIQAAFFAPQLENKFKFAGAFDFFRSLHKSQQYVVAQPIKIDIMPLPKSEKFDDVTAIGQFSKFTIDVNQNTAPAGQGIVLSTELCGNANFEIMERPILLLPESFNYYDSNMVTINESRKCKRSEFIVQATTPGVYSIKPQSLVYFDPVDEQYKTIESNTLPDITITEAVQFESDSQDFDKIDSELIDSSEHMPKKLHDFFILQPTSLYVSKTTMIPLDWFQFILWSLFMMWLLLALYRFVLKDYFEQHAGLKVFMIYLQAMNSYKKALSKNDVTMLYPIFMKIFSQLLINNHGELRDVAIVQYLVDKDYSNEQIDLWDEFYAEILQASFSLKVQSQQQALFDQALFWIKTLKDKS